jgi:small subunit ribosomal protein S6
MTEHYELVYLLRVTSTEEDSKSLHDQITATIGKNGKLVKSGEIGKRKLAFPIKHEEHAVYWLVEFESDTQAIRELHRMLSLDQRILRFQIVETKPKTQEDVEREERIKESIEKSKIRDQQVEKEKERVKDKEEEKVADKTKEKEKLTLDELDKKLDELLDDDSLTS